MCRCYCCVASTFDAQGVDVNLVTPSFRAETALAAAALGPAALDPTSIAAAVQVGSSGLRRKQNGRRGDKRRGSRHGSGSSGSEPGGATGGSGQVPRLESMFLQPSGRSLGAGAQSPAHLEALALLLDHPLCAVDLRDSRGYTALMVASVHGLERPCLALLAAGANRRLTLEEHYYGGTTMDIEGTGSVTRGEGLGLGANRDMLLLEGARARILVGASCRDHGGGGGDARALAEGHGHLALAHCILAADPARLSLPSACRRGLAVAVEGLLRQRPECLNRLDYYLDLGDHGGDSGDDRGDDSGDGGDSCDGDDEARDIGGDDEDGHDDADRDDDEEDDGARGEELASTPLIAAVMGGRAAIVRRLLNCPGLVVDAPNHRGETALMHAVAVAARARRNQWAQGRRAREVLQEGDTEAAAAFWGAAGSGTSERPGREDLDGDGGGGGGGGGGDNDDIDDDPLLLRASFSTHGAPSPCRRNRRSAAQPWLRRVPISDANEVLGLLLAAGADPHRQDLSGESALAWALRRQGVAGCVRV